MRKRHCAQRTRLEQGEEAAQTFSRRQGQRLRTSLSRWSQERLRPTLVPWQLQMLAARAGPHTHAHQFPVTATTLSLQSTSV